MVSAAATTLNDIALKDYLCQEQTQGPPDLLERPEGFMIEHLLCVASRTEKGVFANFFFLPFFKSDDRRLSKFRLFPN